MSGRLVVLAALLLTATAAAGRAPNSTSPALHSKAAAQPVGPGRMIFSCRLRDGKIATVTREGGGFVYRYGAAGRPELTIVGTAAAGNISQRSAVHGGAYDIQLRFVRGQYSYIVHSFPRSDIVDNVPRSGLMVFRAGKRIMDRDCSPWAAMTFGGFDSLFELPEIAEGTPSAWGD